MSFIRYNSNTFWCNICSIWKPWIIPLLCQILAKFTTNCQNKNYSRGWYHLNALLLFGLSTLLFLRISTKFVIIKIWRLEWENERGKFPAFVMAYPAGWIITSLFLAKCTFWCKFNTILKKLSFLYSNAQGIHFDAIWSALNFCIHDWNETFCCVLR